MVTHHSPRCALYPGTFDPMTLGHLDVVERASQLYDEVVVAVAQNSNKKPLFQEHDRVAMIADAVRHLPNVRADSFAGLTVDFAKSIGACAIVRGLRAISDFEYEMGIALVNRRLNPDVTTVFLIANEKYTYLNSSIVRELARHRRNVTDFVTPFVQAKLSEQFPPLA
jgi:pantetheine-phosphate adenylyltransferase